MKWFPWKALTGVTLDGFVLILRQEHTREFKKLKIYIKMYPLSLWQCAQRWSYGIFWWMDHVTAVTHPQEFKFTHVFSNVSLQHLVVHSLQLFRRQRWADGSSNYHRLTANSMLMKPGFLRSSQYVLLETHLSLWLVSTTFLKEKAHISVFCPAYFKPCGQTVHSVVMLWGISGEFKNMFLFVLFLFTWRSSAQVWHCSPLSTSSWFSADLRYAVSLKTPFPGFLLRGICMSQWTHLAFGLVVNPAKGNQPLVGSEPGVCAGEHIFQFGAKFVQLNGKPGEAIVELIVCGHGAWKQQKTATEFGNSVHLGVGVSLWMPTWPPHAFGRRWDTAVNTLVPFPKQPVDCFTFLIHHKPLDLIHIWTPVVSLE